MMRKLSFFFAAFALLVASGLPALADTQTVTLTTALEPGSTLALRVQSVAPVIVDWGDGVPVSYTGSQILGQTKGQVIRLSSGSSWTSLDCSNASLTGIEMSETSGLLSLYCSGNSLTDLYLTACTQLQELDCSHNRLSALDLSATTRLVYLNCADNALTALSAGAASGLQTLICSQNQLSSLPLTSNAALMDLWCEQNNLSRLSFTRNNKLRTILACDNVLTSAYVGALAGLEDYWVDRNELTSISLKADTALLTLSADSNRLATLNIDNLSEQNKAYYLNCANNQLGMGGLYPRSYVTNYIYAPQAPVQLDFSSLNVGEAHAISSLLTNHENKLTGIVAFYNAQDSALLSRSGTAPDYSYSASRGVTFLKPYAQVYGTITSYSYPGLTLYTTPFSVNNPTGINSAYTQTDNVKAASQDGALLLWATSPATISVYNALGQQVWTGTVGKDATRIALPAGIYIVDGKKISIK